MDRNTYLAYLFTFLDIPYKWGGSHRLEGLDCSGAAQLWLDALCIDPPGDQSAHGLYVHFKTVGKKLLDIDLGTLLFFGTVDHVTHVAMAISDKLMIEAGGGGSKTLTLEDAIRQGAYIKISRINRRSDLVAAIKPIGIPW